MLQAKDQEQQPAADRRRQNQGQRQDDIEEPLEDPRQAGDVICQGKAAKEDEDAGNSSNAQAVPERIPIHKQPSLADRAEADALENRHGFLAFEVIEEILSFLLVLAVLHDGSRINDLAAHVFCRFVDRF